MVAASRLLRHALTGRFERAFTAFVSLLFAASVALTYYACASMSAVGMPMIGGWTMTMAWMRMPGQTWFGAGVSFLGMWMVMMVAMMLPSLAPTLLGYRRTLAAASPLGIARSMALAGAGYFFIWTLVGAIAFPIGVALASLAMKEPALGRVAPLAMGAVVIMAGAFQFTAWKTRQLVRCQIAECHPGTHSSVGPCREGIRLGLACTGCCLNLMVVLLALGVMDLRAMAAVTVAITAERLVPRGTTTARIVGGAAIATGALLMVRAVVA